MEKDMLQDDTGYDPSSLSIDELWSRLFRVGEKPSSKASEPPITPVSEPLAKPAPKVGITIQRSDAANKRKQAWLLETPPPVRKRPPPSEPQHPSLQPQKAVGPLPPPPIPVEVEPGIRQSTYRTSQRMYPGNIRPA